MSIQAVISYRNALDSRLDLLFFFLHHNGGDTACTWLPILCILNLDLFLGKQYAIVTPVPVCFSTAVASQQVVIKRDNADLFHCVE